MFGEIDTRAGAGGTTERQTHRICPAIEKITTSANTNYSNTTSLLALDELRMREARSVKDFLQSELDLGFLFASISLAQLAAEAEVGDEARRCALRIVEGVKRLLDVTGEFESNEVGNRVCELESLLGQIQLG